MIQVNENGFVSAREVHKLLDIKKRFSVWFENALGFFENEYKVTPYLWVHPQNNQQFEDFWIEIDMAKEICMTSKNGKELRKYLLSLDNKKQEGLLLQHEEILTLPSLIEASFVKEFRDKARSSHLSIYLPNNPKGKDYAKANIQRNFICGINKEDIAKRLYEMNERSKSVEKDLIRVDRYELIRIAVIDCLTYFGKSEKYAVNVGNLCKKLAEKQNSHFTRENQLFSLPKEYHQIYLKLC